MDTRYWERRQNIERIFVTENRLENCVREVVSPSGKFRLAICPYSRGPGTRSYSRGIVTRICDGRTVADIKRNYGIFWYAWIQYPDGNEYLLCGEDYQGYSIVNLTEETCRTFFPEEGYAGAGFCWGAVYPSPDGLMLAVEGCYWAYPYEIVLYDFRAPENVPLLELARFDSPDDSVLRWSDNETLTVTSAIPVRKSDGKPYDELNRSEQEILDTDPKLVENRLNTLEIKRPAVR